MLSESARELSLSPIIDIEWNVNRTTFGYGKARLNVQRRFRKWRVSLCEVDRPRPLQAPAMLCTDTPDPFFVHGNTSDALCEGLDGVINQAVPQLLEEIRVH